MGRCPQDGTTYLVGKNGGDANGAEAGSIYLPAQTQKNHPLTMEDSMESNDRENMLAGLLASQAALNELVGKCLRGLRPDHYVVFLSVPGDDVGENHTQHLQFSAGGDAGRAATDVAQLTALMLQNPRTRDHFILACQQVAMQFMAAPSAEPEETIEDKLNHILDDADPDDIPKC